jgi:transcriptional regulator with XRE-family HTH domain
MEKTKKYRPVVPTISLDSLTALIGNTSIEAKGKRLRYAREFAQLTREEISSFACVKEPTYRDWENGFTPITPKRLGLISKGLLEKGYYCSPEWLESGVGTLPEWTEEKRMQSEAAWFVKVNPNAIYFTVDNDSMLPQYEPGDIVAGIKYTGDLISSAIGRDCLVELPDKRTLLRRLYAGDKAHCYHLVCLNAKNNTDKNILNNATLESAAPIKWHRKRK